MKNLLCILLSLLISFSAYATEYDFEKDNLNYCKQQAELQGITDELESGSFVNDCMESMNTSNDEINVDQPKE